MKNALVLALILLSMHAPAQKRVNPVIRNYGTIFDIPFAEEKPDPNVEYKIIVEIARQSDRSDSVNWALNNVARLINLHVMAGVKPEQLHVVIAIHSEAIYTVMNNEAYRNKYKVDNPNLGLFQELDKAGVRIVACGQSILFRKIDRFKMVPQVKIASSMITTLTSYQMNGYAVLSF